MGGGGGGGGKGYVAPPPKLLEGGGLAPHDPLFLCLCVELYNFLSC